MENENGVWYVGDCTHELEERLQMDLSDKKNSMNQGSSGGNGIRLAGKE